MSAFLHQGCNSNLIYFSGFQSLVSRHGESSLSLDELLQLLNYLLSQIGFGTLLLKSQKSSASFHHGQFSDTDHQSAFRSLSTLPVFYNLIQIISLPSLNPQNCPDSPAHVRSAVHRNLSVGQFWLLLVSVEISYTKATCPLNTNGACIEIFLESYKLTKCQALS